MPLKHTPPEWLLYLFALLSTAVAGALGAFVRQIGSTEKSLMRRMAEWVAGAVAAIYATPVVAPVIYRLLERHDLVSAPLTLENITGLAGFLSGALGITVIELAVKILRKYFGLHGI